MMDKISKNDIDLLRQPFPLEAHSVHEGPANNNGDKCMWFVYLDKFAIMERLDDLFPGEWDFLMTPPVARDKHYSCVGTLSIRGVSRQLNGTQKISTESWATPGNDEKGVGTDTFRRAATMWGVGAYLGKLSDINMWTAKPAKGDWDADKKAKAEVMSRLGAWLRKQYGGANSGKPPASKKEPSPETEISWPTERIDKLIEYWNKEGLMVSEILRFAGITNKYDDSQWDKYATGQDASAAIQKAFDKATNVNQLMTSTFRYMSYVGKGGTLLFATSDPGEGEYTIATLWGGRGAIKSMYGNDELYEQLELSQYDNIKNKNIVSDWTKMIVNVDFEFESKRNKDSNEEYFAIIGIAGDPVIQF